MTRIATGKGVGHRAGIRRSQRHSDRLRRQEAKLGNALEKNSGTAPVAGILKPRITTEAPHNPDRSSSERPPRFLPGMKVLRELIVVIW